jgi:hypothetical protein
MNLADAKALAWTSYQFINQIKIGRASGRERVWTTV